MLMDYVRCDSIEERPIMGSEDKVSKSEQKITLALTRRQVFLATSGDNLLAMPTHSGRLYTHQRRA
jgi:hypothetical protein